MPAMESVLSPRGFKHQAADTGISEKRFIVVQSHTLL